MTVVKTLKPLDGRAPPNAPRDDLVSYMKPSIHRHPWLCSAAAPLHRARRRVTSLGTGLARSTLPVAVLASGCDAPPRDDPRAESRAFESRAATPIIEIRLFNPLASRTSHLVGFMTDFDRVNHRMHNKLTVGSAHRVHLLRLKAADTPWVVL